MKNSFLENIPQNLENEIFEILVKGKDIQIERIISHGQCSPKDFWYDQELNEFVAVIKGSACIEFENQNKIILNPGDYINIQKHEKHRVEWTNPDTTTIWLAVFYQTKD